jgi:proline dehydrogenase
VVNPLLLAAAKSPRARSAVTSFPATRRVVDRFVAGETLQDAVATTRELLADGRRVTLDHLGEGTTDRGRAEAVVTAYTDLLRALDDAGLADRAEVSVKLSALGQALPGDGERVALDLARQVCGAAAAAGTTVTLDMEDHTTVDSTLSVLRELRRDFPWVGAVLQSMLRRTEGDARDLAVAGSRVRLVKGAYAEPASVAVRGDEIDAAYVRCLGTLFRGAGYPMVGSHDPALVAEAERLAGETGRDPGSYEFQMLYGIRAQEQRRIAASGRTLRVYVPYGTDWYGYFMRRLAERPANVAFFLRSFVPTR